MQRQTLLDILRRAGATGAPPAAMQFSEEHEVCFYLGEPGQAMVVRRATGASLHDEFVEIEAREPAARWFVAYASVHAVTTRVETERAVRRAGF